MFTKKRSLLCNFVAGLLICSNSWGAMIPTAPTLTVGGAVFTDLSNLIVLGCAGITTINYTTCRKPNGTTGYQITAGKTFTVRAVLVCEALSASTTAQTFQLLYGDTDVGFNSASAPTNPVREFNWAAGTGVLSTAPNASAGGSCVAYTTFFQVPATKYAAIQLSSSISTHVLLYGYEN